MSVWCRYTPSLKNCYTPLIPDRPYREMRWSDERKDKRCVHKKEDTSRSQNGSVSLDLGTKIMLPNSDSEGKDSVDLIRDSLFSIQVQQPWLLLQFGNSNAEEIGTDRVETLVSASPEDEDGKTREEVVKTEIEDNDNNNLTIPQVVNRLGMVFFLLFFNLGITIFVFLLTGMMLFSQILFIIFAMFLPISFLLSMIPSYESMAKQANPLIVLPLLSSKVTPPNMV